MSWRLFREGIGFGTAENNISMEYKVTTCVMASTAQNLGVQWRANYEPVKML